MIKQQQFWPFDLVISDDLELIHIFQRLRSVLSRARIAINADLLAAYTLNNAISAGNPSHRKRSNILPLTWPVTSSLTSGSRTLILSSWIFQGHRMSFEILNQPGIVLRSKRGYPPFCKFCYPYGAGKRVNKSFIWKLCEGHFDP